MKALFTPAQWSLIDLANQYGLDKKPFEERIKWAKDLLPKLYSCNKIFELHNQFESYIEEAGEPELFTAALLNVWDITQGRPTGHYVELDSNSSGPQLLSLLTRCEVGMRNTGTLGDDVPDLYTTIYKIMKEAAPTLSIIKRHNVKKAAIPYVYGSYVSPKKVFGDFYELFTKAYHKAVPRAEVVKNLLIAAWNPNVEYYEWEMPDGHTVHIKVIVNNQITFTYNGQPFTYHYEQTGTKAVGDLGTKMLAARVTHSYDAYVLREVNARCDYNKEQFILAKDAIKAYVRGESQTGTDINLKRLERLSDKFKQVSIKGVDHIQRGFLHGISKTYLLRLLDLINKSIEYKSTKLKLIHDGFGALPSGVNGLKTHYNNVCVDSYMSDWLMVIIEQLTGQDYRKFIEPPKPEVAKQIANNKYAIS